MPSMHEVLDVSPSIAWYRPDTVTHTVTAAFGRHKGHSSAKDALARLSYSVMEEKTITTKGKVNMLVQLP